MIGLPWIAADMKTLDALMSAATVRERLDAAIERAGAIPLAYAPLGLRALGERQSLPLAQRSRGTSSCRSYLDRARVQ